MGTKMGPSVACLTMGHFEEQLFSQYTGSHPFLYKRYIDDIVGVATGTRSRSGIFHSICRIFLSIFEIHTLYF
ncbi:hypothetical protein HOLleu_42187 [Holothuria leucospilota]|uniref:Reverse transcriptase domain-containing protein n=1 Tax=Holothuria leucospilota TaxID=206669 RepID=A0A9Q0YF49_HOLLE|nr:hypothetical protein HOLleu_42187 [Holothuria leucospilota]